MSQPSTPFNDAAIDPFLPSFEHEDFTQAQLDDLFGSDEPVFSAANSDVLDDLDFTFDDGSTPLTFDSSTPLTPFDSSTPSTPYDLSRPTSSYPLPGAHSPHPYPLDHHYQHTLPIRSHTPTFLIPPQPYLRRRSLSTNDLAPPNPTFIRLQRSYTPDRARHIRSVSQGPGRPLKHGSGTPIGTPLHENRYDPYVRRMVDPARLAQSRRIIEIGAMGVRRQEKVDLGKMLDEVERLVEGNEGALRGVRMVREAMAKVKVEDKDEDVEAMALDKPSGILEGEGGLFGGYLDENDLMGMLMRKNEGVDGE